MIPESTFLDLEERTTLEAAIYFAADAHHFQIDKCGKLYILHPLRVMMSLKTTKEKIVGVLHDVLEDTLVLSEEIENIFGKEIREAVESVSRGWIGNDGVMIFKDLMDEDKTKETYKDFIKRSKLHPIGRQVKIADIMDNMLPERHNCLPENQRGIIHRYESALEELRS